MKYSKQMTNLLEALGIEPNTVMQVNFHTHHVDVLRLVEGRDRMGNFRTRIDTYDVKENNRLELRERD